MALILVLRGEVEAKICWEIALIKSRKFLSFLKIQLKSNFKRKTSDVTVSENMCRVSPVIPGVWRQAQQEQQYECSSAFSVSLCHTAWAQFMITLLDLVILFCIAFKTAKQAYRNKGRNLHIFCFNRLYLNFCLYYSNNIFSEEKLVT